VTEAVNVTLAPNADGVPELARTMEDIAFTPCESARLEEPVLPASPL
jgi:hypothetical protein